MKTIRPIWIPMLAAVLSMLSALFIAATLAYEMALGIVTPQEILTDCCGIAANVILAGVCITLAKMLKRPSG